MERKLSVTQREEKETQRERRGQGKLRGASHLHTLKMRKVNDCARKKPLEL